MLAACFSIAHQQTHDWSNRTFSPVAEPANASAATFGFDWLDERFKLIKIALPALLPRGDDGCERVRFRREDEPAAETRTIRTKVGHGCRFFLLSPLVFESMWHLFEVLSVTV